MVFQRDEKIRQLNERLIDLEDKLEKRNLKQYGNQAAQGFEQFDVLKDKLAHSMAQNQELKKDLLSA